MAGSFNIFRRYQKIALAALAVMAMLAFVVLPQLMQVGGDGVAAGNPLVVSWQGGGLRESGLDRAVVTRRALNQFLMALQAAASGSDRVQPPLPDDEKSVVDSMLLAREAEANGIVISDTVVNDFIAIWTGNRVSQEDIRSVIDQLRSRAGITEQDIFDGLRTLLLGERMQALALRGTGVESAPPGWRWDAFRRLEQSATVEVVPVIVESLSDEVPEPSAAALRAVYEQYKEDLPEARSSTPGFREPARIRYDAIVGTPDVFLAEAEKEVSDEEIAKFYEENKDSLYKQADQPADPAEQAEEPAAAETPAEKAEEKAEPAPAAEQKGEPAAETGEPAAKTTQQPPTAEPKVDPKVDPKATPADAAAELPKAAKVAQGGVIRPVAFRQPRSDAAADAADAVKDVAKDVADPAGTPAARSPAKAEQGEEASESAKTDGKDGSETPTENTPAEPEVAYEPLDKVRDDVRTRLARQAADRKVGEIFDKISSRIATYADDLELALGVGEPVPSPPDVEKMAAEYGLEVVRSDFVDASEAIAAGGVGASFQLSFSERFGVRQQQWVAMFFAPEAARWRPAVTRDMAGNRYLSWKNEDRPEFTPTFAEVQEDVQRVWRLLEARPLATKQAEAIVALAPGSTLAEAVAGQEGVEATTVGPFTWLTRGTAPFGSAPVLSQPAGVQMAGEDFMEAVFGLEPGERAVAFNEPQTICYAIRLAGFEPVEETLRERFVDASTDPRRLSMMAEDETREVRSRWLEEIEKRYAVEWKREPR
jgi:hypothetical protein